MTSSSESTQHDYVAKVAAIMRQAESVAGTPEADVFLARAAKLMAKHGIEEAMLAAVGETKDEAAHFVVSATNPYARDKAQLIRNVAVALRCDTVRDIKYRPGTRQTLRSIDMHLFGMESDLRRVAMLLDSLTLQMLRGANNVEIPWHANTASEVAAVRRAWMAGFSRGVFERIDSAEKRAVRDFDEDRATGKAPSGPSTALVLVDRKAQVEKIKNTTFPNLVNTGSRKLSGGRAAFLAGKAAGQRADIGESGRTLGGERRQALG